MVIALYTCILGLALLTIGPSHAFFSFRKRIPNGEFVPHPCIAGRLWAGVGHENTDGGGARNPFGLDFGRAGYKWTSDLCRQDSDGDGQTNGEELGDPDCVWKKGSVPARDTNITHPGVCNPVGQGKCKGRDSFVNCAEKSFEEYCPLSTDPNITALELRFTNFTIPSIETIYFCQHFDLPADQDYHILAIEPIINNKELMHHSLLYGCPDNFQGHRFEYPESCGMTIKPGTCGVLLATWGYGLKGTCYGYDKGIRIGRNGYKSVKLEIHYNNPMLHADMRDASGTRLYLQVAKPGVQDMAILSAGQFIFEVPPGKEEFDVMGVCPANCTKQLIAKPMYIVSTGNHMHSNGLRQKTVLYRDGAPYKVLAFDDPFDYNVPVFHQQTPPLQVLPGDEIRTTCTYNSKASNRYLHFGDSTSDEMCLVFIDFYPSDAMPMTSLCSSLGPLTRCDSIFGVPVHGCDWKRFTNLTDPDTKLIAHKLEKNCNLNGLCRPECKEVVDEIKQHPCLTRENNMDLLMIRFLENHLEGTKFLGRLYSCLSQPGAKSCPDCDDSKCGGGSTSIYTASMKATALVSILATILTIIIQ